MEQIQKFLPLLLRLVAGLAGLEGKVVLSTMTELLVDQVAEEEARQLEAKLRPELVELQHRDKEIMVGLKLLRIYQQWAAEEVEQLVDRPLEAQRLELLDLVEQVVVILELLMPAAEAVGLRAEQAEQAEAEEEVMEVRQQKMVRMDLPIRAEEAEEQELLANLVALEVAELLLSAMQSNGSFC